MSRFASKRLRQEVIDRDGHVCQYCGASVYGKNLHIDHVYPYSMGGKTIIDNLVVSCSECNRAKSNYLGIYPQPKSVLSDLVMEKSKTSYNIRFSLYIVFSFFGLACMLLYIGVITHNPILIDIGVGGEFFTFVLWIDWIVTGKHYI